MNLHAAHAHAPAGRQQLQLITIRNGARDQRARHHRAEAAHGKGAINRQPRQPLVRARWDPVRQIAQRQIAQGGYAV